MPYYPSSQIKPNQYTNGGEYILSTTKKDYKGPYYEVSNGQKYTGNSPQDGANILLIKKTPLNTIKTENDFNIITGLESPNLITTINYASTATYLNLTSNPNINERSLPTPYPPSPTDQDFILGVYTRYFCKKNNENKYMEIDKTTFDKLNSKSKDIAWDLYTPISTLWYLRRDTDPYLINKRLITQIEQKQGWYGFTQWFKEKF
jgi:hypothetical protein